MADSAGSAGATPANFTTAEAVGLRVLKPGKYMPLIVRNAYRGGRYIMINWPR